MSGLISILWNLVVSTFGWLVAATGSLLDTAVRDYIINFGALYTGGAAGGTGSGVGYAIETSWSAVRDFFNIFFIFGLVYLGFKMILGSDESGTKRWLAHLIMAALLVNFSLFITKIIVDFANLIATEIYTAFPNGIAQEFMRRFGIQSSLNSIPSAGAPPNNFVIVFATAITFLIAAFVFAAGALMIIIRFVALSLYMVMSPLMFLGWVFPQLQGVSRKYWTGFLGRAFFAPIFVLLNYFSAIILNSLNITSNFGAAATATNISSITGILVPFIIGSAFMIASLVVANKLGADGASQAIKVGNSFRNGAQKRFNNSMRWGARKIERGVTAAPRYAAKRTSNALGNQLNRNLERFQNSQLMSRDPNTGRMNTRTGRVLRAVGADVMIDDVARGTATKLKGNKFGFRDTVDETTRKQAAIDSRVTNNETVRNGLSARQQLSWQDSAIVGADQIYDLENHRVVDIDPDDNTERDRITQNNEAIRARLERQVGEMQSVVGDMTAKQLEAMLNNQSEMFGQIISEMKQSQVDKLIESESIPQDIKNRIFGQRQEAIRNTLVRDGEIVSDQISKLSIKQIETLGDQFIRDHVHNFTQSQMDALGKSDSFSDQQKGSYKRIRKDNQVNLIESGSEDDRRSLFNNLKGSTTTRDETTGQINIQRDWSPKKPVEVANLPSEVLLDDNAVPHINQSILEEIYSKKTLTAAQRNELSAKILQSNSTEPNVIEAQNYLRSTRGRRDYTLAEDTTTPAPATQETQNPNQAQIDQQLQTLRDSMNRRNS